jgi:hypothetical protein
MSRLVEEGPLVGTRTAVGFVEGLAVGGEGGEKKALNRTRVDLAEVGEEGEEEKERWT